MDEEEEDLYRTRLQTFPRSKATEITQNSNNTLKKKPPAYKAERERITVNQEVISKEVDIAYGRVMLLGASGVGKSSLIRGLKNEHFIEAGDSTQLADVKHINHSWAKGKIEHEWKDVDDDDEVNELAILLAAVSTDEQSAEQIISEVKSVKALYPPCDIPDETTCATAVSVGDTQAEKIDDYLQKALERAKNLSPQEISNLKPSPFLHIWDCGGQTIFLEVLPAFLTPRTMFLLLFDASKSFDENFINIQLKKGTRVVERDTGVTVLHLLKCWLAMIHAYLEKKEKAVVLDYPRVSLVGTHGDKKQKSIEKSQIEEIKSLKESFHLIQSDHIVDNTKAGKGQNEDPSYKKIREEIYDFATKYLAVKTPVSWVLFRKIITTASKSVINYSEAKAIAIACKIAEEDVQRALAFFHDLGVILYYPQVKGLRDKVIINPEWFVKCLGKVLSLEGNEEYKMEGMWRVFREKGILVQSLYGAVWRNIEGGIDSESIMELMVHLHLAAEVVTNEYADLDVSQYFVPCVLKNFVGDAQPFNFKLKATPLQIKFNTNFVPPGYFTRFSTTIASYSACNLDFKRDMYRNHVSFEFGLGVKYDHVVLTETSNAIQIQIGRNALDSDDIPSFSTSCQDFLTIVKASCREVDDLYHRSIMNGDNFRMPIKVYSQIKMVCKPGVCSSVTTQGNGSRQSLEHYLKIDLNQHELKKTTLVDCEKCDEFRMLGENEEHWFCSALKVNKKEDRVTGKEMVKISQEVKEGESLAACLEMQSNWHRIVNDNVSNRVLRLLHQYDISGGTRTRLVEALKEIKEVVLADELFSCRDELPAISSTRSREKVLQRRGVFSLTASLPLFSVPAAMPLSAPPYGYFKGFSFTEGTVNNKEITNERVVSSHCPTIRETTEVQHQDHEQLSTSAIDSTNQTTVPEQNAGRNDSMSTVADLSSDHSLNETQSVEGATGTNEDTLKKTDLLKCSRYIKMNCDEFASFLEIPQTEVDQMKATYPNSDAHIYHVLLLWMKKEQRTKQEVIDICEALGLDNAVKSLIDSSFKPSSGQRQCSVM